MVPYFLWAAAGFFSGSVMYGYLLPKWLFHKDITRLSKDGNPGCGNVFTCVGIPCGVLCLLLELAKGALPVWLAARALNMRSPLFAFVIAAPVLGHAFSPMMGWRGGKAIAVTFGAFIGLAPKMWLLFWLACPLVVFSTVIHLTPHSLRVMVSYAVMLLTALLLESTISAKFGALMIAGTVVYKHIGDFLSREKGRYDCHLFSLHLSGRL